MAENQMVCRTRTPRIAGIMVGSRPEEGHAPDATGASWEGVSVLNNTLTYEPTLPKPGAKPTIRVVAHGAEQKITKLLVSGNIILGNGRLDSWGIEAAYLADSVISDNAIHGAMGGLLMRDGFTRNLAQGNRITDVTGAAYRLERSGGENRFLNNFVFGLVGVPYDLAGAHGSDHMATK